MGLYVDDEDFWGRPKEPPKTLNTIDERADYLKVELLQNWENLGGDQTLELIKELPENDWFIVLTQNGRAFPGFFPILVDDLKNGDIFKIEAQGTLDRKAMGLFESTEEYEKAKKLDEKIDEILHMIREELREKLKDSI